jgi:exodeoxyribonuclease VII large subunit
VPAPSTPEEPWPVRTVSRLVGDWLGRLGSVWVEGQVASLSRRPGASVAFVTLRDPSADVSMTLTVPPALLGTLEPPLAEGQQVVVHATPHWYMSRGTLSLQATEVRAVGLGALLARLERLRTMLAQEGLFDPARKKPLPFLPRAVGLICGRESDAKHDVVENARRRWAAVTFDVREVPVQGPNAVPAIVDALGALDRAPAVDVIVIARGGGDVQELLPFSDEALIRAVAATKTPVVSAIGHEAHAPLLDFVADVRASTPTDAGKLVVPDVAEETARIARLRRSAWRCADALVERQAADVAQHAARARRALAGRLDQGTRDVAAALARVTAMSPRATLDRGYAIVQRADGSVLRAASDTQPDDPLTVRLAAGTVDVTVNAAPSGPASPSAAR